MAGDQGKQPMLGEEGLRPAIDGSLTPEKVALIRGLLLRSPGGGGGMLEKPMRD